MDSDDRELQIREVLTSYYSYILEEKKLHKSYSKENIHGVFRIKISNNKISSHISDSTLYNFVHTVKKDTNTLIYHLKQLTILTEKITRNLFLFCTKMERIKDKARKYIHNKYG